MIKKNEMSGKQYGFWIIKNSLEEGNIFNEKFDNLPSTIYKVAWLLKKYKKARNSDTLLIYYFWKHSKVLNKLPYGDFNITEPSNIVRRRNELQKNIGLFLPDDKTVIDKRGLSDMVKVWKKSPLYKW